ncbi:hypothetical protein F4780DRAFT_96052 [Xylariomycetidae sp. FL0641]|nr:hypothetical protein F4780DRAFT_96052 [Xylariomycetidae sp. FL0641]
MQRCFPISLSRHPSRSHTQVLCTSFREDGAHVSCEGGLRARNVRSVHTIRSCYPLAIVAHAKEPFSGSCTSVPSRFHVPCPYRWTTNSLPPGISVIKYISTCQRPPSRPRQSRLSTPRRSARCPGMIRVPPVLPLLMPTADVRALEMLATSWHAAGVANLRVYISDVLPEVGRRSEVAAALVTVRLLDSPTCRRGVGARRCTVTLRLRPGNVGVGALTR